MAVAALRFRRLGVLLAPLIDILAFCGFLAAGLSLRAGNAYAFAIGYALSLLLRGPARAAEEPRSSAQPQSGWRLWLSCAIAGFMAVFLRAGVLALLIQQWHWAPQISILFAAALGLAVTAPRRRNPAFENLAFGLIAYAVVLRLVYAGSIELMPEETYYWNYARHLDLGYLDHPPMVAWLIRSGTAIFGQTEFGVRAGALCCGLITSIFVYKLTRNLFGAAAALAAVLLAQALPFFFLSGLLMTPDAALVAAWAAALYFLERALIGGQSRAWWFAGISLGIGMISKYSIALLGPVAVAFMLWDPPSRRWWRRPEPYVGLLLALAIFSPVIIWNAQHEWASFAFQTSRRLAETPQFALHKLIGSIIVLITPTGLLAVIAMLWRPQPGEDPAPAAARRRRLFGLAILFPLALFAVFSLRHEVKLDWTGAPWTAALPAMAFVMVNGDAKAGGLARWIRAAWMPTVVAMLLIFGAGLQYLVLGLPGVGYDKHIEVIPVGWRDLSAHIVATAGAYRKENGRDVLIVGMDRYAIASELAFYGGSHTATGLATANSHLFGGMGLMYGQWMPPRAQAGRDLLLVAFSPGELDDKFIRAHVERLGPIEDDVLMRDGVIVRHYYHRLAFNYRARDDDYDLK
ncbi:MAG TPA: glycosyltransferase family 39 protein [Steroidobacteraceae bacterium]|nr:glycosyltransferase family 39 protein [Steroidobacteraceae bacterium]